VPGLAPAEAPGALSDPGSIERGRRLEYQGKEYGDEPRYTNKVCPTTGAKFHSQYFNKTCAAVIAYDEHNITVNGNPKITLIKRPDGHEYGHEISMQMNITGQKYDPYRIDSVKEHKVIEIYMPASKETVTFLEKAISMLRFRMQQEGITQ
jgi:hypothetical protein